MNRIDRNGVAFFKYATVRHEQLGLGFVVDPNHDLGIKVMFMFVAPMVIVDPNLIEACLVPPQVQQKMHEMASGITPTQYVVPDTIPHLSFSHKLSCLEKLDKPT